MKYLGILLVLLIGIFIGIMIDKFLFNSLVKSTTKQIIGQSKTKFYPESTTAERKDTKDIEIRETMVSTHNGGNSYQLNILVNKSSRLLPERIHLVEKGTENEFSNNLATLARFQSSGCREKTDPKLITRYETEFFKVDRTLPFPDTQPSLKDGFKVVMVYQDEIGNRYFSINEVTSICNVMME